MILHGRNLERGNALREELGEENAAFCQGDLGESDAPAQATTAPGSLDAQRHLASAALNPPRSSRPMRAAMLEKECGVKALSPDAAMETSPVSSRVMSYSLPSMMSECSSK